MGALAWGLFLPLHRPAVLDAEARRKPVAETKKPNPELSRASLEKVARVSLRRSPAVVSQPIPTRPKTPVKPKLTGKVKIFKGWRLKATAVDRDDPGRSSALFLNPAAVEKSCCLFSGESLEKARIKRINDDCVELEEAGRSIVLQPQNPIMSPTDVSPDFIPPGNARNLTDSRKMGNRSFGRKPAP